MTVLHFPGKTLSMKSCEPLLKRLRNKTFLASLLVFLSMNAYSQKNLPGYFIKINGDTVVCSIAKPAQFLLATRNVLTNKSQIKEDERAMTIVDSVYGKDSVILAANILGYGYTDGKKIHNFISIPQLNKDTIFLERMSTGPEVIAYRQLVYVETRDVWVGSGEVYNLVYYIRRSSGALLDLKQADRLIVSKFALKSFFSDLPQIDKILWGRFTHDVYFERDVLYVLSRVNDPTLPLILLQNGN
jgi:hypothetical protein